MPEWLIALLNNPLAITALGTVFFTPLLAFLAQVFMRSSPPPGPIAYDARDIPEHPLLVAAKVHLADEEMALITGIGRKVDQIDAQLQLVHDRIDLLMRR
ncbi:hypothetical protein Sa4125_24860 [Aureimonas sp. SA4125]|uniref:hypothetical protein n=1 Tax=Aureimonas sp. SA4125 TaxID=2826993 RepID=UPI001CC4ADCD|nr:hypothetical protein [Aureimonas sp. SA4125]BDA84944.1 hypothetical protein Sa4125_24860 [Aureimonas sp. SA4125]